MLVSSGTSSLESNVEILQGRYTRCRTNCGQNLTARDGHCSTASLVDRHFGAKSYLSLDLARRRSWPLKQHNCSKQLVCALQHYATVLALPRFQLPHPHP